MLLQAKCQNIYHSNGVVALSKLCIVIAMLLAVLRSASRTMQVSGTMVQTHFPSTCGHTILWLSTLHLLQVASLLSSSFFLSCFPCLTLATSTASSAWQQLEESTRVFKSSPVILQLQLPSSSLEVQAWSWLAPGVYSPGVYHVLKWEFVEMDKLCRWTGS